MRKPKIWFTLIMILLLSFSAINAATVKLGVTAIAVDDAIDATATVPYLTDDDLNTVWEAVGAAGFD
jgi:hypothetical protein